MELLTAELLETEVLEKDRVEDIIKEFEEANGIIRESEEDELHAPDYKKGAAHKE